MHVPIKRPAAAVAVLAFAVPATAAHAALTAAGPLDPATKAPAFYTDANGLSLGLCHPGTANCGPPWQAMQPPLPWKSASPRWAAAVSVPWSKREAGGSSCSR